MAELYSEAVSWLTIYSQDYVVDGKMVLPRTEPSRNIMMLQLGIYWVPYDLEGRTDDTRGYFQCDNDAAEKLLNHCEQDAAAFDLCKEIAAHRLATNGDFLPALQTFTALYMTDCISRPPVKRRSFTWLRNMLLLTMAKVSSLSFELSLTRSDDGSLEKSACDAVVAALANNGHHLSYRAVKELCVGTGKENQLLRQDFYNWAEAQRVAIARDEIAAKLFDRSWLGVGVSKLPPS